MICFRIYAPVSGKKSRTVLMQWQSTRFIAERFSYLAFALPPLYFLLKGYALAFLMIITAILLLNLSGQYFTSIPTFQLYLALMVLSGFNNYWLAGISLRVRGYHCIDSILARDEAEAQFIYIRRHLLEQE